MKSPLIDSILDLLPIVATNRKWAVMRHGGAIRSSLGECPICAVVNELRGDPPELHMVSWKSLAYRALDSLDILVDFNPETYEQVETFMRAADSNEIVFEPAAGVRREILARLNLA